MVKFNKELLLREDVSIRITSEKEFQALLDWCREEFNYGDIDIHYNNWWDRSIEHINITYGEWMWTKSLNTDTAISFEEALIKEYNSQPKLKSGMFADISTPISGDIRCIIVDYNGRLEFMTKDLNCQCTFNTSYIKKLYTPTTVNPHMCFSSDKYVSLLWKKEDDKKAKLQDKLDALEESHKQAVAEIKKELKEM